MVAAVLSAGRLATDVLQLRSTIRIGITGLARAGKTALLTSLAANLLALSAGRPALPAVSDRLRGRRLRVSIAPAEASSIPRFEVASHIAALAADPPRWPTRTTAVSLLALDVDVPREGLLAPLGPQRRRLEFLDYPGEWLLDLPLLSQDFADWSEATLRRLETLNSAEMARAFLGFVRGLPAGVGADEALTLTGHRLYTDVLRRMRDEAGLAFLQPGRFLMPPPGAPPPWTQFFPLPGRSPLANLMQARFSAYVDAVRRDLMSPMFGDLDGLVVLADLLSALHQGQAGFADARSALAAAADALRWDRSWTDWLAAFARLKLPPRAIRRVAFAATKADHIAARQRGNLAALMRRSLVCRMAARHPPSSRLPRCAVPRMWWKRWPVDQFRPSAAASLASPGRRASIPVRFLTACPTTSFWQHRFLALPDFEPMRLPEAGRGGIPQLGLDALIAFLLADIL